MTTSARKLKPLQSSQLAALPGIRHGFFGRAGGVSEAAFASLNCGILSGDKPACVEENRARVCHAVGARAMFSVHQVHGDQVREVTDASDAAQMPRADALVTTSRGLALAVLGADCPGVLFAAAEVGAVAAAHAGWRGALGGVTDAALNALAANGAEIARIVCAIGPGIQMASYEVDAAFEKTFIAQSPIKCDECFASASESSKRRFDLPRYIELRLRARGVQHVERLRDDTYADAAGFFSYRRACHQDEPNYGRQANVICLA